LGHVLIAEMKLPLLGREEDAADTYAALRLLSFGTSFSQQELAQAAQGWFLNDRRDQEIGEKPLYYDEHNLNQQRAYQILCLITNLEMLCEFRVMLRLCCIEIRSNPAPLPVLPAT
jgi:hypothetical protein